MLRFSKYEGIGNDFLVIDRGEDDPEMGSEEARLLCDRHFGVGADGVLSVSMEEGAPRMRVINADGSVPEMCGNGIRCVALHLARTGMVPEEEITIHTDAGPHRCRVASVGHLAEVEVEMRAPSLDPSVVPLESEVPLVGADFEVDGMILSVTAISMGNPHLVTFDPVGERRLALGPRIEKDPRFPKGVNVGFAETRGEGEGRTIDLHVWERGAGWTRACGTGACAAAVAAVETGRSRRGEPTPIRLPGGTLVIRVGEPGSPVIMRGPARHVFDGELSMEKLGEVG